MNSGNNDKRTILIAGIDTVRHKNLYQFKVMEQHGYEFIVLTTDNLGNSSDILNGQNNVRLIVTRHGFKGSIFLLALLKILMTTRIDLMEVYPYSVCMMVGSAISRILRIPVAIIARGEEYYYLQGKMSRLTMFAFRATYRLANHVIYKELYAKDFFDSMGVDSRFFLPNAVGTPNARRLHKPDRCIFLFINSLKPFRHPEIPLKAFLKICAERSLGKDSGIELRIVGFQGEGAPPDIATKERSIRELIADEPADIPVKLLPWTNKAIDEIRQADVFLLPADVVFLNYSLLEAMAHGLLPMVQDAPDAERIIDHERDGFILPCTVADWKHAMKTVLDDFEKRQNMATLAHDKIESHFSLAAYERTYHSIYQQIIARR